MAKRSAERQTSTKVGVRSMAKKTDSSRYGLGTMPASRQKGGAFAQEDRPLSRRAPGTATPHRGKASALRKMR